MSNFLEAVAAVEHDAGCAMFRPEGKLGWGYVAPCSCVTRDARIAKGVEAVFDYARSIKYEAKSTRVFLDCAQCAFTEASR